MKRTSCTRKSSEESLVIPGRLCKRANDCGNCNAFAFDHKFENLG